MGERVRGREERRGLKKVDEKGDEIREVREEK